MSRIDDLIRDLCPDGVEYKPLGEVARYSPRKVSAEDLNSTTFVGVDNLVSHKRGRIDATHTPNTSTLTAYSPGSILLGNIRPYLKKIWLADRTGGCSGDVLAVEINDRHPKQLEPRFLYYVLSSDSFFTFDQQNARGAKMPRGNKKAILRYPVPVPPLEVQHETTRILDKFTQLEAELEAELEARQHQYTYYRDILVAPQNSSQLVKLGAVSRIARGASPRPIRQFITDSTGVPWIKIGDVPPGGKHITSTAQHISEDGATRSRRIKPGDFILSNSMSFGRPFISKIDGCIHDGWLVISDYEKTFDQDFLYHVLRSSPIQKDFTQRAGSGTVRNLNSTIVGETLVPAPPIDQQRDIVDLLDKFDLLVNDLTSGLPAEIEARRKQYEYYRDRLLTFPEKK